FNSPKVGEYIVNLKEFERLSIPAITINKGDEGKRQVIVIDEVGKMESFSNDFNEIVRNLVLKENDVNDVCVLGTVAMKHGGLAEEIRNEAGFGKNFIKEENKNL